MELELNPMDFTMPQLPTEMWEKILWTLDDSNDILNLFTAYPGLEGILENKKPAWLMDQVVPHLFHYLPRRELLFCRQVSRRWNRAVDNFLENHPLRKPYDYQAPITETIWRPDAYRKYSATYYYDRFPVMKFGSEYDFDEFLNIMDSYPSARNPFVGRSVDIKAHPFDGMYPDELWTGATELLRKFGKEIWFLRLRMTVPYTVHYWETLELLLHHLPNLKEFEFVTDFQYFNWDPEHEYRLAQLIPVTPLQLPPLPKLNHLVIQHPDLQPFLAEEFVYRYAAQLSNFRLDVEYWQEGCSSLFLSLTALSLGHRTSGNFRCKAILVRQEFNKVLMTINCPELRSLELQFPSHIRYDEQPVSMEDEVLRWIRRFPSLQSLHCSGWPAQKESEISQADATVLPFRSLRSLEIKESRYEYGHALSSNFLRCFPNLQYLATCYNDRSGTGPFYPIPPPTLRFDELVEGKNIYKSILWEMFPKLLEIQIWSKRFKRDAYEHFQRYLNEWPELK